MKGRRKPNGHQKKEENKPLEEQFMKEMSIINISMKSLVTLKVTQLFV